MSALMPADSNCWGFAVSYDAVGVGLDETEIGLEPVAAFLMSVIVFKS